MKKEVRTFVSDFETTVYKGQTRTEVWAACQAELYSEEEPVIYGSINEYLSQLFSMKTNTVTYFHNLAFDGEFILHYILYYLNFRESALIPFNIEAPNGFQFFKKNKLMPNNTYRYLIDDMGKWYTMTLKVGGYCHEFRDSYKLVPFSIANIGKSYKTKHQKLEMEYTGFRYPNCPISEEEQHYIKNDVLVIKEVLEYMIKEGHDRLTIGSCCMREFKRTYNKEEYAELFPDCENILVPEFKYGSPDLYQYIKKSYRGGWCYRHRNSMGSGVTLDVNSLYPSVMHSMSENYYPIGKPLAFFQKAIPKILLNQKNKYYYFVRAKFNFELKKKYLPFIQIKHSYLYLGNENLATSKIDGKSRYIFDGEECSTAVTMTMTMTDWELIQEHYDITDLEIIDGCYFNCRKGIFDEYINKYKKIKEVSTGAERGTAKLFLNNLYGRLASGNNSSFKVAYLDEENKIKYKTVSESEKDTGYIPCGSAITAYAREFTIRTAQKNYDNFCYADTDSIHCDTDIEKIKGVQQHATEFCCWKLESKWDKAQFTRQKTYIEHIVADDKGEVEPYFLIKGAGVPKKSAYLLNLNLSKIEESDERLLKLSEEEKEFVLKPLEMSDYKKGLVIPGNLKKKRIFGGILLVEGTYTMR